MGLPANEAEVYGERTLKKMCSLFPQVRDGSIQRVLLFAVVMMSSYGLHCHGLQDSSTAPDTAGANTSWQERYLPPGPVCGLLCAQAALRTLELEIPPLAEWLEPENFSGYEGSSASQLRRLLHAQGGKTIALSGMSLNTLRYIDDPVIVHTTSFGPGSDYNHWILFLGIDRNGAWICDLPGNPVAVPVAHLESIWNGTGIIVSRDHPSLAEPFVASMMFDVLLPLLGVASILILLNSGVGRSVLRGTNDRKHAVYAAGITCVLAIVARHVVMPDGMLWNPDEIRSVQSRLIPVDVPELNSWSEVSEILAREPNARLIDTRTYLEFQLGSIPGAISCPWVTSSSERRAIMRDIDKKAALIAFCGSDNCPFGHSISRRLAVEGFQNLWVYTGGYADWKLRSLSERPDDESR